MERALLNNILKIYSLGFCHAFQLVIPVFVPLLMGKGLSMAEILQTQAIFALTVAMFEVPSGYFADVYGRKTSLILSALLLVLGYACLYSAESFHDFLVFEVVMGVAWSLGSGADLAMLFDSQLALQKLNAKFRLPPSVGKLVSLAAVAEGLAAIAASVLFLALDDELAFEVVLGAQLLIGLPPLLIAFTLVEPPRTLRAQSHHDNAREIIGTLVYGDRVVLWTAVTMVVFGLFALYAFWTFQPFWVEQGVALEYFGFLWALHCALRGTSAFAASRLEEWFGAKQLLIVLTALPVVAFLGMAGMPGWAAVACALMFPICRGVNSVILYDALNKRVDAAFRATINSVLNLVIRAVFIVTGPLLGLAVDRFGLSVTLFGLAVLACAVLSVATVLLLGALSRPTVAADQAAELIEQPK